MVSFEWLLKKYAVTLTKVKCHNNAVQKLKWWNLKCKFKFLKDYALYTCESEIRAIAAAFVSVKTTLYIHKLLAESVEKGVLDQYVEAESVIKLSSPITILEDNKAAVQWALKGMNTSRMRHVEISLYWVRQYTARKLIKLEYIKSEDQLADLGTKPLSVTVFRKLAQQIIQYHM
jgi:hypothetical protein